MHSAPAKPLWFYFAGLLPTCLLLGLIWQIPGSRIGALEYALSLGFPMPVFALFTCASILAFRPAKTPPEEHLSMWQSALRTVEASAILPAFALLIWQPFHFFNILRLSPAKNARAYYESWHLILLIGVLSWVAAILYCGYFRRRLLGQLTGQLRVANWKLQTSAACLCLLAGSAWIVWVALWGGELWYRITFASSTFCANLACALLFATALISIGWQNLPSTNDMTGPSALLVRALSRISVPLLSLHATLETLLKVDFLPSYAKMMPFLHGYHYLFLGASMAGLLAGAWWEWIPRRVSRRTEHSGPQALSSLTWSCSVSGLVALVCYMICLGVWEP